MTAQQSRTPSWIDSLPAPHPTQYAHIAMNRWSSLPRGEEVLTFALQSTMRRITQQSLLEFAGEREMKAWMEGIVRDLAVSQPTVVFYDSGIETLLFEVVNFEHTLHLDHIEFLPRHHFSTPAHRVHTEPLADTVNDLRSRATTSLAQRKRALKALQIARGETRWTEAFTDGSFVHERGLGGAAFLRDDGAYGALQFRAENSNEAEYVAALIAISSARGGEKVSINSDSRLVVRSLTNLIARAEGKKEPYPTVRTLARLESATLEALAEVIHPGQVRARWVRGHCGDKMNHGADLLAKAVRKRRGRVTVKSAEGIVRQATGASAPVSYGFTTIDLAVPDWYGDYLKNGDKNDVEDPRESQFDGPFREGEGGGPGWLVRRASA